MDLSGRFARRQFTRTYIVYLSNFTPEKRNKLKNKRKKTVTAHVESKLN